MHPVDRFVSSRADMRKIDVVSYANITHFYDFRSNPFKTCPYVLSQDLFNVFASHGVHKKGHGTMALAHCDCSHFLSHLHDNIRRASPTRKL